MKNARKISAVAIIVCIVIHIGYVALQFSQRLKPDDILNDVVNVESSMLTSDEATRLESLCEQKGKESHLYFYVRDQGEAVDNADLSNSVVIYLQDKGISDVQTGVKHENVIQKTGSAYLDVVGAVNGISAEQVGNNNSRYFDMIAVQGHIKKMIALFMGLTGVLFIMNVWRSRRNGC